jgi:hypothetical protein
MNLKGVEKLEYFATSVAKTLTNLVREEPCSCDLLEGLSNQYYFYGNLSFQLCNTHQAAAAAAKKKKKKNTF